MHRQYQLDPHSVELPFGSAGAAPPWEMELDEGHRLALRGRIDRIDLHAHASEDSAYCVVVDYKSSQKKLDPLLVAHGLQLQLLAYLNVLCQWPQAKDTFGFTRLLPAGVFYVNLRGQYESAQNRRDALKAAGESRTLAYRHTGRFDASALRILDSRKEAQQGDQFNYRLKKDGGLNKSSREAIATADFQALLGSVASTLQRMGRQIYSGTIKVDPYRKGGTTACDYCDYASICRIDPWTHQYRVLRAPEEEQESE
jgi:ATP-dependent helicase/nuclease subunit B